MNNSIGGSGVSRRERSCKYRVNRSKKSGSASGCTGRRGGIDAESNVVHGHNHHQKESSKKTSASASSSSRKTKISSGSYMLAPVPASSAMTVTSSRRRKFGDDHDLAAHYAETRRHRSKLFTSFDSNVHLKNYSFGTT